MPVDTFLRSQQHTDDLVRELWLISGSSDSAAPRGLGDELDGCSRRMSAFRDASLDLVVAASDRGDRKVDLRLDVPPDTAELVAELTGLLERLDDLSRAGTLLTLPSSDEVRDFRRWLAEETRRQLRDGRQPTAHSGRQLVS